MTCITQDDLTRVSLGTLTSFLEGNFDRGIFTWGEIRNCLSDLDGFSTLDSLLKEGSVVQISADMLDFSVAIKANYKDMIIISSSENMIKLIESLCEITDTDYLVSYNGVLLEYRRD